MCKSPEDGFIHLCNGSVGHPAPQGNKIPTIVFSSPNRDQYKEFEKGGSTRVIVNVWSERELCAWAHCMSLPWHTVNERYLQVGGMPRYINSVESFTARREEVQKALNSISNDKATMYITGNPERSHPTHTLMSIERAGTDYLNKPHTKGIAERILAVVESIHGAERLKWCHDILCNRSVCGWFFEAMLLCSLQYPPLFKLTVRGFTHLGPEKEKARDVIALIHKYIDGEEQGKRRIPSRKWRSDTQVVVNVQYRPEDTKFPVIDAFITCEGILLCFQTTISSTHAPNASAVLKFMGHIDDVLTTQRPVHKVVVFVQAAGTAPMANAQTLQMKGAVSKKVLPGVEEFWDSCLQFEVAVGEEMLGKLRGERDRMDLVRTYEFGSTPRIFVDANDQRVRAALWHSHAFFCVLLTACVRMRPFFVLPTEHS